MNKLKEKLKDEIGVAYDYFTDEQHFNEVDNSIGHSQDALRM